MYKIVDFDELDKQAYLKLCLLGQNSTPFHQYDWLKNASLINQKYRLKILCFYKSQNLIAALPFFDSNYISLFCISSIAGTYGGMVYTSYPKDVKLHNKLFSQFNIIGDNYKKYLWLGDKVVTQETFVLKINKPYETILGTLHSKTRNQIKKARKSGLIFDHIKKNQNINECYDLYLRLQTKHSIDSPYNKKFFYGLLSESIVSENIDVIIAKDNKKIIAFGVFIIGKEEVFYFMSSFDNSYSAMNPINGILDFILNKYSLIKLNLNFGTVPYGNSNLKHFKDRWGAKVIEVTQVKSFFWNVLSFFRKAIR